MKAPKDVLALGQAIVGQLELDQRGAVLERWLAHHLAEVLSEVDTQSGAARVESEQKAVDLILKLWMHRRALPEPADPLGGFRDAIAVVGRLLPEANPWARYSRGPKEQVLSDLFECMCRIVFGSIALTQSSYARELTQAETKALSGEESQLLAALQTWLPFVRERRQPPVVVRIVDGANDHEAETPGITGTAPESRPQTHEQELASTLLSNMEHLQEDLATLIERWKAATSAQDAADATDDDDLED